MEPIGTRWKIYSKNMEHYLSKDPLGFSTKVPRPGVVLFFLLKSFERF